MPTATDYLPPRAHSRRDATRAERTGELFERLARTGDPAQRRGLVDEIVAANLPVADSIAGRYGRRGTPLEDLEQVARLALVRAAASFRPAMGHDFLSYAVPSIRGEVRRYFRDQAWMVRPPRRVQEAQLQMTPLRESFLQGQGREPVAADYVAALSLDEATVVEVLSVNDCYHPESLEGSLEDESGDGSSLGDRVGVLESGFDRAEARTMLAPVLARLAPRDRTVLRLRYVDGLTQREVGEHIGVTQMQVSRILQRILDDLRQQLGELEAA